MAPSVKVSGSHLIDGNGAPLQLRGVNVSALEFVAIQNASSTPKANFDNWGGQSPNLAAIAGWGANCIRVPLNEQSYLAQTCTDQTGAKLLADPGGNYKSAVQSIVSAATALGLYVILDLHKNAPNVNGAPALSNTPAQSEMADADNSLAFWTAVATDYKNSPNVLFDLFNEPHIDNFANPTAFAPNAGTTLPAGLNPEAAWPCAVIRDGGTGNLIYANGQTYSQPYATAGMQAMLNAVRAAGATNVCMISGPSWAEELMLWVQYAPIDPLQQIAASWHAYGQTQTPNYPSFPPGTLWGQPGGSYDWAQAVLAAGFPIIIGECGGSGSATTLFQTLLPWADTNKVSVIAWTWNTGFAESMISDQTGTPIANGIPFKAWLQSHSGGTGVAKFTTLTLETLPKTRSDGTAVSASDIGSANVYKNGIKYSTINAPLTVGETWSDAAAAVTGDKYTVSINDTQSPAVEGVQSAPYTVGGIVVTPKSPLSAPTITGVTA